MTGARLLDVSHRGAIKVTGEDRARLLHAMTTNHIQQLAPGQGCYAFFLSAQGRILADVNVLCRPDHLLLDTEPEVKDKVFQHLDKYIIADDAYLEDLTDTLAQFALEGEGAESVLRAAGAPVPSNPGDNADWGDRLVARISLTGGAGWRVFSAPGDAAALNAELSSRGAMQATSEEFRVARLENGAPRYGEDISERYLAQETNQMHAIHFQKGCYLGQEIVERVRSRAQIHRVLTPLRIEGSEPPAPGARLETPEGAPAGEITSAAYSPALGMIAALAYVRTEHAAPGKLLRLGGREAAVVTRP